MAPAARKRLPERRKKYTQKFKIGGHTFYFTVGMYADGTPGEIFIDTSKAGAAFRSLAESVAIMASLGLQYGVPLEEYVEAFVGYHFDPSGTVQDHDRIKYATSFIDVIFRDMAIHFLGRDELAHTPGPQPFAPEPEKTAGRKSQTIHV